MIQRKNISRIILGFSGFAFLSFFFLFFIRPFWLDEINTILYIQHSWKEIIELTKSDFSPPLYYLILKTWSLLGGKSEWFFRIPSLFFGLLSMVTFFFFSRRWFGKNIATISAIAFFFSYSQLHYFAEARMYSLFVFLALLGTTFLFELWFCENTLSKKKQFFLLSGFFLTSALGVYTHYAYWFFLFAQNIAIAKKIFYKNRFERTSWLLAQLGIVVAYIPWWQTFFERLYLTQIAAPHYWTSFFSNDTKFFLENLIFSAFVNPYEESMIIFFVLKIFLFITFLLFFFEIHFDVSSLFLLRPKKKWDEKLLALLIISMVPILIIFFFKLSIIRYILPSLAFILLIIIIFLHQIEYRSLGKYISWGICVLIIFSTLNGMFADRNSPSRHWKEIGNRIEERRDKTKNTAFVVPSILSARAFQYYYNGSLPIFDAFPDSRILDSNNIFKSKNLLIGIPVIENELDTISLKSNLKEFEEVWLVQDTLENLFADPKKLIPALFQKEFQKKEEFLMRNPVLSNSNFVRITRWVR